MNILTGQARLAGVVGWPVAHSRSPMLHNHWLGRYGIDGAYLPLAVAPARLPEALRGLAAVGFAGVNVTLPHKEAALALCDRLEDSARRAGAANTLVFGADGICGSNTDGDGFLENLRAYGVDPARGPALVLGAGGAARAVVAALRGLGVAVTVAARSAERAAPLLAAFAGTRLVGFDAAGSALAEHALLVNATSRGLAGHDGAETSPVALDLAPAGLVVNDLVYVPPETPLLRAARAAGLVCVPGLGMLIHQARPGFAAWFGTWPEADAEAEALLLRDIAGPPRDVAAR